MDDLNPSFAFGGHTDLTAGTPCCGKPGSCVNMFEGCLWRVEHARRLAQGPPGISTADVIAKAAQDPVPDTPQPQTGAGTARLRAAIEQDRGGHLAPPRVTFDGPVRIFRPAFWGDGRRLTLRQKIALRLGREVAWEPIPGRINHVPTGETFYDDEGRPEVWGG